MRSWSPSARCETSTAISVGMLPGSASTVTVKNSCSSMPPSFAPGGSPSRLSGISAATATSRRTRTKSTCTSSLRVGWRWIWRASASASS